VSMYANIPTEYIIKYQTIQILDYQLGKDPKVDKFIAFLEIQIITERGIIPYSGTRTVKV
jgi:RecB family exonuclease